MTLAWRSISATCFISVPCYCYSMQAVKILAVFVVLVFALLYAFTPVLPRAGAEFNMFDTELLEKLVKSQERQAKALERIADRLDKNSGQSWEATGPGFRVVQR